MDFCGGAQLNEDSEMLESDDFIDHSGVKMSTAVGMLVTLNTFPLHNKPYTWPDANIPTEPTVLRQQIPTREDWESHRPTITRLYRDEKRSLKDVVEIMSNHYNHHATERMYKKRISDWDIRRNLRWSEREAVCRMLEQELNAVDNQKVIVIKGQEKRLALFKRHMKRKQRPRLDVLQDDRRDCSAGVKDWRVFAPVDGVQRIMYPAGDERSVEIVCTQIRRICEVSTSPLVGCYDALFGNIWHAVRKTREKRYNEARVLLNRAGDLFREAVLQHPDAMLLDILRCFSLRSEDTMKEFDPVELLCRHAIDLTVAIHGPNHPLTITLTHMRSVRDWVELASSATQIALDAVLARDATDELVLTKHWLRQSLGDVFEISGNFFRARSMRLTVVEDIRLDRSVDVLDKVDAASTLALHYVRLEPQRHDEAERLYRGIFDIATDLEVGLAAAYATYYASHGMATLKVKRGDLGDAERYLRQSIEAAATCWGKTDCDAIGAMEDLARLLERQGKVEEAEKIWNMCELDDGLEMLDEIDLTDPLEPLEDRQPESTYIMNAANHLES